MFEFYRRLELVHPRHFPMFRKATLVEIEPGQSECALGIPASDANELIVDVQRLGVCGDPTGDNLWDGAKNELAEHHVVNNTLAEFPRAVGKCGSQLVRAKRIQRAEIQLDAEERRNN
ncbi:MAG: hypothetical protein QNM02_19220 [Acidimicrobiia bacterium]|nr:hypothetical protein [Acidimicrobiia bacterium]